MHAVYALAAMRKSGRAAIYHCGNVDNRRKTKGRQAVDRLDALKVFCTVVETGSFRGGADRMGVSTSSVTNQIAALETRFGVRLLNRTTRRMSMTEEGRHCYQMAQRILGDIGTLDDDRSGAHRDVRGLLRIDMPGLVSRLFVAPHLSSFLARYPAINLRATVSDR